jgi:hypothetical protein
MLWSCGTPFYEGYDAAKDEWWINGTSPGGMYGGFTGTEPSPDAVRAEAAKICRNGYDTISEGGPHPFFEGSVFQLRIRCRKPVEPTQN